MPGEPTYNPIFTRFVELDRDSSEQLPGLVAYGRYKVAKREWVREFFVTYGRKPTEEELEGYAKSWTASRLKGLEDEAETALANFAAAIVDQNAPDIRERALKGTTTRAILTSIAANFIYTLLLIGIVVLLRISGVDLLSIAGSIGSGVSTTAPPAAQAPSGAK